jgi:hypothetical protein
MSWGKWSNSEDPRIIVAALEACGLETPKRIQAVRHTKETAAGLLIDSGLSEAEAMASPGIGRRASSSGT